MTEPIIEAKIRLVDQAIRLEWGMPVDPERRRWLWKHRQLEVRLYCDPYLDFDKPIIQTMALDTRSTTRGVTFNVPFVENIVGLTAELTQSAYMPGLPAADPSGKFYPVTFDLSPNDIPAGGLVTYPVLEFPVASSGWRLKPFSVWAVFGYEERDQFEPVSILRQFDYRPEEPHLISDLPLATNGPVLNRSLVQGLTPYLRWLHEESKRSGLLRVLNPRDATVDAKSVTVDDVYTPLNTRSVIQDHELGMTRIQSSPALIQAARERRQGTSSDGREVRIVPLSVMRAAHELGGLVLLGDPGSGKSTFLKFLTLGLTGHFLDQQVNWLQILQEQGWNRGGRVPVLITLREFAQSIQPNATIGTAGMITDYLAAFLTSENLQDALPPIEAALEQGEALVMFDGLDEVPASLREVVRQSLISFIELRYPNNRYIVTCRILSYTNPGWKLPGLKEEIIAPFDNKQIQRFVRAWYKALHTLGEIAAEAAEHRANELVLQIRNDQLAKIAENPMLLTVMAIVHNHQGALPKEIARLYQDCVKLLMQKWRDTAATSLMTALGVRDVDLDQMLEQIAYQAHSKQAERQGAADIPEHDIIGIARTRLGGDLNKAGIFCEYVEKQAGLLIGRGQTAAGWRVFSFPHRTFQEFLAGRWAANNDFPEIAPELAERGANWRETLLLATGHLVFNQGQTALALSAVDSLCPPDDAPQTELDWQKVWLASDMLRLIGMERAEATRKGPGLIKRLRQRLVDLIEGGHLPPVERAAAGRNLSVLGDQRPGVGLRPVPPLQAAQHNLTMTNAVRAADKERGFKACPVLNDQGS